MRSYPTRSTPFRGSASSASGSRAMLRIAPRDHPRKKSARRLACPRGGLRGDVTGPLPRTGGAPLPAAERQHFEHRFGRDFPAIRQHADGRAAAHAADLHARASTSGTHVGLAAGAYRPGSPAGRTLICHELMHVAQVQAAGAGSATARAFALLHEFVHLSGPSATPERAAGSGRTP